MNSSESIWIYHEPQDSALCGQHCLNNLLQNPLFTVGDLADIAEMLDMKEKQFMMEGGSDTVHAIKFLAEDSGNVDESGNFSIEVLKAALQNSTNIELIPWFPMVALERNEDPSSEIGFIVNRANHWFAVRRVGNHWWDLNSFNSAPQHISMFYLSAFLAQLAQDGYSVFAARGNFPKIDRSDIQSMPKLWHPEANLLPAGIAKSQQGGAAGQQSFQGTGHRLGGPKTAASSAPTLSSTGGAMTEDEELAHAIAMSLAESQQEPVLSEKEQLRAKRLAALDSRRMGGG
jgi:Ataxin-3